jgi:hypothetical protein
MSKYGLRQVQPPKRPWKVHPIWRGIGCFLALIGPILALAAAHLLALELNRVFPLPGELLRSRTLAVPPDVTYFIGIAPIGISIAHWYADLILAGLLLLMGFGVIMVIYAVIYGMMGPSRYGPMDSPPVRSSVKKKRR